MDVLNPLSVISVIEDYDLILANWTCPWSYHHPVVSASNTNQSHIWHKHLTNSSQVKRNKTRRSYLTAWLISTKKEPIGGQIIIDDEKKKSRPGKRSLVSDFSSGESINLILLLYHLPSLLLTLFFTWEPSSPQVGNWTNIQNERRAQDSMLYLLEIPGHQISWSWTLKPWRRAPEQNRKKSNSYFENILREFTLI